ncbi:MAG TPA: hypothetical protein VIJ26_14215, partial [Thermoanaerobaculia bacterium]
MKRHRQSPPLSALLVVAMLLLLQLACSAAKKEAEMKPPPLAANLPPPPSPPPPAAPAPELAKLSALGYVAGGVEGGSPGLGAAGVPGELDTEEYGRIAESS